MITRRDLIGQKTADIFTGRQEELSALARALSDPQSVGFINLYGISGIGKTFLLSKLVETARAQQCVACYIDLAFCSSRISLLNKLADTLTMPFLSDPENAYLSVRKRYRDIHIRLQTSGNLTPSALAQISRISDFDGEVVQTNVELHRSALEQSDIIIAQNVLGSDYQFFRDPSAELARAVVLDINRLSAIRLQSLSIVIALDRSEKVPENLLTWFRDQVFYDLAQNVVLMVAGQRALNDGWDDLLQLGLSVELKPLTEADTAALTTKLGVNDLSVTEWVYKASGGIPLFAATLCRAYARDPGISDQGSHQISPPEGIMERYLSGIAPDQRDVVLQGAVLRYLSLENAAAVFGVEAAARLLYIFRQLHFVSEGPKGFVIHDRVRDFLNRYLLKQNPSRFVEVSAAAAEYYNALGNRGISIFECLTEELYHSVRSETKIGLDRLKEAFDHHSLLNEPEACEVLVGTALLAGLEAPEWSSFFRAAILYQRAEFRSSHRILAQLLADVTLPMEQDLRGLVLFYYSVTSWYLCEFKDSLEYATQAVEALEQARPSGALAERRNTFHLNRAIGVIGLTQDRLGRFGDGIATVQRMAVAARESQDLTSLGYALNSSGYFSWHEGHWKKADLFLCESIAVWGQLQSDFGACYPLGHRAALRCIIGDPRYDVDAMRRCIELAVDVEGIRRWSANLVITTRKLSGPQGDFRSAFMRRGQR